MNKREFKNQFPPLHAKFIFHALSNALSSTKFEQETVGLQSLDKLRIYQCFFFSILQRNLAIIYDVEEWEPIATCAHMRTLHWIQSERLLVFELPLTTSVTALLKKIEPKSSPRLHVAFP